jgi:Surface lipoprotein assembly modifier
LTLSYSDTLSAEDNSRSNTWALRGSYAFSRPLGPAKLTLSAGIQFQEYPDFRFFNLYDGRNDRRISVGMDAFFPDYAYAGFAPVISLNANQTESNNPFFNKDDLSISFSFRSTF